MKTSYLLVPIVIAATVLSGWSVSIVEKAISPFIKLSAEKAVLYLIKNQKRNGQIILDENEIFNVWETVISTRAIALWAHLTSVNIDSVTALSHEFIKNSESIEGLVYQQNFNHGSYCIETSAEYIRLLVNGNLNVKNKAFTKAVFISSQQLITGEWNIHSDVIPESIQKFPSVTGFAMCALYEAGVKVKYTDAALAFFRNTQSRNGHWGMEWEYYGTPFYAIYPILEAVSLYDSAGNYKDIVISAKKFIFEEQRENGSFDLISDAKGNHISSELQTVLALQALLSCEMSIHEEKKFQKGVEWLLTQQKDDGSWNGGFFPVPNINFKKKEDVFCTSQVLIFFHRYLERKKSKR